MNPANTPPEDDARYQFRYRFGTAVFDESTYRLQVADAPVEVERRALDVLIHLLRHAGEVVTKEELFREVWHGRITVDKVLPNAITKLRKALGPDNAALLVTKPRIGYQLNGVHERMVVRSRAPSALTLHAGEPAPYRAHFVLRQSLGAGHGNQVWLAAHIKTGERRVYKYAETGAHLNALKREATLARVLQAERTHAAHAGFARILDWNFENAPFFLEYAYAGEDLRRWADAHLHALDASARLALFLQIARTVSDAHQLGVLHKDIKPANILVEADGTGAWQTRLIDFGSGGLLEPDRLEALGITRHDLTGTRFLGSDGTFGSPLYLAPEVFAGHPQTIQSDVYALGQILYQMLAGDLSRPMAPGWEKDIDDPLLQQDIALATDGDPAIRLPSVAALIERLETLRDRRESAARRRQADAEHAALQQEMLRRRARRPFVLSSIVLLVAGLAATLWLYRSAEAARDAAQTELQTATALNAFVNQDLIGQANPVINGSRADASVRDVLIAARDRVGDRFASQPAVAAGIHTTLSSLFGSIELLDLAEDEARRALAIRERSSGPAHPDTLRARSTLVRHLSRNGKHDEADTQLAEFDHHAGSNPSPHLQLYRNVSEGIALANRGDIAAAVPHLERAIALYPQVEPEDLTSLDALRLDLGQLYTRSGREADAGALMTQLIDDLTQRTPDNPVRIAIARQVLADVRTREERFDEAKALLDEAAPVIDGILGPHSVNAMMVAYGRGLLARKRGDWPAAIAHTRDFVDSARMRLGEDHPSTFATHGTLGQILLLADETASAEHELRVAYHGLGAGDALDNPMARNNARWYLLSLARLGRAPEALEIVAALRDSASEDSDTPFERAMIDGAEGLARAAQGDAAGARPLLQSALVQFEDPTPEERTSLVAPFSEALARLPPA